MAKKKKSHHRAKRRPYTQIISPIHHLEHVVEQVDRDNDRMQVKVLLLTILGVILGLVGILLALFYNN